MSDEKNGLVQALEKLIDFGLSFGEPPVSQVVLEGLPAIWGSVDNDIHESFPGVFKNGEILTKSNRYEDAQDTALARPRTDRALSGSI